MGNQKGSLHFCCYQERTDCGLQGVHQGTAQGRVDPLRGEGHQRATRDCAIEIEEEEDSVDLSLASMLGLNEPPRTRVAELAKEMRQQQRLSIKPRSSKCRMQVRWQQRRSYRQLLRSRRHQERDLLSHSRPLRGR